MTGLVTLETDVGGWTVRRNREVARHARASGLWPDRTVADFARQRAAEHPDKIQIIDNGNAFTCAQIYDDARRLAGHFAVAGLRPGDVVSFQLPNWWEANVVNIAAALLGLVVNPIVPINRDAEVAFMLRDSGAKAIVVPHVFRGFDHASMMERLIASGDFSGQVIVARSAASGFDSLTTILAQQAPVDGPAPVDPDAVKLIMYTSGTTGRPKGVLHSHNSINADSVKMKKAIGLAEDDTVFIPSPVTHVTGYLWVLNMPWYGDVPAITIDIWNPAEAFETLARHGCAFMAGATPFLKDLLREARNRGATLPLLRNYLCGGAAVPPSLIREAAEVFAECIPWRNYGSTEAPTLTRGPESRDTLRLGAETDGRIYEAEVKIVDVTTSQCVAPGGEGEILVREPSMSLGYTRVEDNSGAYDEDGFFRMGDIGRIVEGDHLLLTDRIKDIIIRSGENLSSKEIEDALLSSPAINDAAVVGIPSEKTGEAVFAFLVAREGEDIGLPQLLDIVAAAGLARQKTPEHFALVDELPRTPSGKVLKHELRRRARLASHAD